MYEERCDFVEDVDDFAGCAAAGFGGGGVSGHS
jgi:hypothetical protein